MRDSLDEFKICETIVLTCVDALGLVNCEILLCNTDRTLVTAQYSYLPPSQFPEPHSRRVVRVDFPIGRTIAEMDTPQTGFTLSGSSTHQAWFTMPILDVSGKLGEMTLVRPTNQAFTTEEQDWLEQIAAECAIAIRRIRLNQIIQTQTVELKRLSQLQDNFLSTVSYELRIPLANMKMAIQMISLALKPNETEENENLTLSPKMFSKVQRYLEVLQKDCDREAKLIQDLLDLQQLDTDTLSLLISVIQLDEWLPYVVNPFLKRFLECNLRCEVSIEPELPPLMCDQISLSRIMVELLSNAYRYTPVGQQIVISAKQVKDEAEEEPRLHLQVFNAGVEIPREEIPRIFDKFHRVPKLDIRKQGGTGLGLALVQRLVARLGGRVLLESNPTGTLFTIELPFQSQG
ncbi:GAF domain-containing sensor histidine kinase [Alkalinema pantanalense CENA528]|uniref:GAF domain-containing sensor histidine kinase n=1 Tax=Alkalinema pantanalense TaxID=1620705 RepID=UPI003D6F7864